MCACSTPSAPSSSHLRVDPTQLGDGWALSTLAAEGIDAARLETLTQRISNGEFGLVDSLTIARNGRLYNSGGVILLAAILRAATGQDAAGFAADNLFAPIGITDARWSRNSANPEQVHTGGGLSLRSRDQAKFGQAYLDDGV